VGGRGRRELYNSDTGEHESGDVLALNDDSGAAKVQSATSADEGNDVGSLHGDGGACCGGSSAPC
jgi:hypothetical protein